MKEPAKPQNTHHVENNKPFFQAKRDREGPLATSAEPFFTLPTVQTAMTKGKPGDKYEEQAERVAERVVNPSPMGSQPVKRADADVGMKEENGKLQMQEEEELQMQEEEELQMQEEEEELQMQEEEEEIQMQEEEEELQMQDEEEEVQMQDEEEELQMQEEEEELVQMKPGTDTPLVGEGLSRSIKDATGKGQPLSQGTMQKMPHSFGVDFSNVKIHSNDESARMNKQLGAQAFTHGSDIFFNAGKFNPETTAGKKLLAHELTHVVQQQKNHASPRVQGFFKKLKKGIKKVGKAIGRGVKKVGGTLAGGAKKVFGGIKKGAKAIGGLARKAGGALKRGFGAIGRGVRKVAGAVGRGVARAGRWVGSAAGKVWGGLKSVAGKVASVGKKVGKWVWNGVKWVGGKLWEKMGAMYMARAVHAQSNAGYNYEGIDKLAENQTKGLSAFNLEQQGDIIADYYRILTGQEPNWEKSENPDISVFESYVKDL